MTDLGVGLTVCICTRDRPQSLARALQSVTSNAPEAEIVVSDDGESPAMSIVDGVRQCRWQRGPHRGLGANRNAAVEAVKTLWVLFLDDDARLGEGFVAAIEARQSELPEDARPRTIVTGKELKDGRLISPHDVDFLGFQRRDYEPGDPLHTVVINAAVWPTKMFCRVRFDERLLYGSDEVDLSYSALTAGYKIEPCWDAINHHDPDPKGRDTYADSAQASRLRATTKRYWRLRRSRGTAIAFLIVAPVHLAVAMLERDGIRGTASALRILRRWLFG